MFQGEGLSLPRVFFLSFLFLAFLFVPGSPCLRPAHSSCGGIAALRGRRIVALRLATNAAGWDGMGCAHISLLERLFCPACMATPSWSQQMREREAWAGLCFLHSLSAAIAIVTRPAVTTQRKNTKQRCALLCVACVIIFFLPFYHHRTRPKSFGPPPTVARKRNGTTGRCPATPRRQPGRLTAHWCARHLPRVTLVPSTTESWVTGWPA